MAIRPYQKTDEPRQMRKLIDALAGRGGTLDERNQRVAQLIFNRSGNEVRIGNVQNWRMRDTIPYRYRPIVAELAKEKKIKLPPRFLR